MYLTRLVLKRELTLEASKWGGALANITCLLDAIIREPEVAALLLDYLNILESALQQHMATLIYSISSISESFINIGQVIASSAKTRIEVLRNEINQVLNPIKNDPFLSKNCGEGVFSIGIFKEADNFLNSLSSIADSGLFYTQQANLEVEKQISRLTNLQEKLKFVQKLKEYIKDP
jgi:hypothetical protein